MTLSKKKKIDIVVMGTKGAKGIKEILSGSNTAKVISKASCPVIAVPEQTSFEGIKKIIYATDYHSSDIAALKQLTAIAQNFKARINVIHIEDGEYTHLNEKAYIEKFEIKVKKKIDYPHITYQLIHGDNIEKEIEQYLKKESPDILAMSTKHRDMFERLFGKSITKKLVHHTKVPLMVFHYKQEAVVFI